MSIFAVPNERFFVREIGEMPEWSIGPHSKCGVRATVPGVRIPLSPQNPEDKKGSKYDKSRKIKVLRDFLFLLSDIRKTQKSPVRTEYRY